MMSSGRQRPNWSPLATGRQIRNPRSRRHSKLQRSRKERRFRKCSEPALAMSGAQEPSMEEFYRIRRLPPYVFETVNRAKAVARNQGADIVDLGMSNPDLPAPAHVIE